MAFSLVTLITNPIVTFTIIGFLSIFVFYMYSHFKPEKYVELLRPRDSRGKKLSVTQETDLGIVTRKSGGVVHRFIKKGRGWVFNIGGKMVTKFFGIEGTAYTGKPKGDEIENVPVKDYLIFLWGEKFYKSVPAAQRKTVETDVVGITVDITRVDTKKDDLPALTADDINSEDDRRVLEALAGAGERSVKQSLYQWLVPFFLGAAVIYFVIKQGFL